MDKMNAALVGMTIGALIGFLFIIVLQHAHKYEMEELEQEAIERGFAEKDQETGDLIWLEVY